MIFSKSLWIDEGYSNITSLLISQTGKPLYESGYWDGAYLLFHYLQAGMFYLFGYSVEISTILPFIFGLISLFLIYRIASRVFGNSTAVLSVILSILSYQYLVMHLQARYYGLMTLLFLITIVVFLPLMSTWSWKRAFVLTNIVILSLSFHAYLYALIPIIILGLTLSYGGAIYRGGLGRFLGIIRKNWVYIVLMVGNCIGGALIAFALNPGIAPTSVMSTVALSHFDYAVRYAWFFRSEFGILGIAFFGTFLFWQKFKNQKEVLVLIFSFIFPYLVIAKQVYMVANRYVYFLIPIFIILASGFFVLSLDYFRQKYLKAILAIIYLLGGFFTFHTWIGASFPLSMFDSFAPEPDFKRAYEFIEKDMRYSTGSHIISAYPHMDKLYLGRSDGYIYVDETGTGIPPEKNFYIQNNKNIFTLAPVITSVADLDTIASHNGNYILLDQLSSNRLENGNRKLYDAIIQEYMLVFEKKDGGFFIQVYYKP